MLIPIVATIAVILQKQKLPAIKMQARIAVPGFQSSALVLLAEHQGYFRAEGVETVLEYKSTGRDCLDLALKGQADFAVVFETPVVHASLAGNDITILTEMHRSDTNSAVVVRRDHGIEKTEDLVGKKIAAVPRTNAEFLLELLLRSHLVDPSKVTIQSTTIHQAVDAVKSGTVDAAALWEPYLSQALAQDPDAFVRLQSSYYSEFSVLAGRRDTLDFQTDTASAVMRALKRANDFFQTNGPKARAIVDKMLTERGYFVSDTAWKNTDIHIGLSATLLTMLNEEAGWYKSRGKTIAKVDMRHLFRGRYLKDVAPRQVTFE